MSGSTMDDLIAYYGDDWTRPFSTLRLVSCDFHYINCNVDMSHKHTYNVFRCMDIADIHSNP